MTETVCFRRLRLRVFDVPGRALIDPLPPLRLGEHLLESPEDVVALPVSVFFQAPSSSGCSVRIGRAPKTAVAGLNTHPDDHELNEHVHAAIAKHSRRGWRLDKPDRASKIDAVVALAMAVERQAYQPEPVEVVGWI